MADAVVAVIAVFFAGMGVYALAAPDALVRPFGTTLGGAASRSEVRAVYGGFRVGHRTACWRTRRSRDGALRREC